MSEPFEHEYFNWLYAKVNDVSVTNPSWLTYNTLLSELHKTEYIWIVDGDHNRAEDGKELRIEFLNQIGLESNAVWLDETCSVLEMLIAFSRRAAFQTDEEPAVWFWRFMENLALSEQFDSLPPNLQYIQDVLRVFVLRLYSKNGVGGLFPLRQSRKDQRKLEVWYQFSEYVLENQLV